MVALVGLTFLPTAEQANVDTHLAGSGTDSPGDILAKVCAEVGLHDGSTVGSLVARMVAAEAALSSEAVTVATRTALAAIAAASRTNGQVVRVLADASGLPCLSCWQFVSASTLAQDGLSVEGSNIVIQPASGTGRWLRTDTEFDAKIPIGFGTTDAAQLMLVPAGYSVKIAGDPFWDVVTGFTGGTGSAIGISSSNAGSSTKGDLLGGASGDVTATLGTAGVKQGTAGTKLDTIAHRRAARIEATEYLRYDRITDAFLAGAGYVHVPIALSRLG